MLSRKTFLKLKKGNNPTTTTSGKGKKIDRVARYMSLNASWKKSKFLSSQNYKAKEGRKLKLAENHKATAMPPNVMGRTTRDRRGKAGTMVYNIVAPTEKRRDDMTFKIRVAFILMV